jgi:hypothetical protein
MVCMCVLVYSCFMKNSSTLSHPVLRPNRMLIICVPRDQVYTHTIQKWKQINQCYNIIYLLPDNVLQKTKSNTLEDTTTGRLHNSTDNRPGVIARLKHHIEVLQIFFSF